MQVQVDRYQPLAGNVSGRRAVRAYFMRMRFRVRAGAPAVLRLAVMGLAAACVATVCTLAIRPAAHPALGPAARQIDAPGASRRKPHTTIEPTLPVALEARLVSVSAAARGGTARLEISLAADADVEELTLDLQLPEGLRVEDGTPTHGWRTALRAHQPRLYAAALAADRNGAFPIRAEVSFRLADGRSFRAGQGATLHLGTRPPEGRFNAGAYEFRGVPLEDLQR